jgi:hypothetical protein
MRFGCAPCKLYANIRRLVIDEHLLLCLQFSSFNIEATINGSTVMSIIHLASLESP